MGVRWFAFQTWGFGAPPPPHRLVLAWGWEQERAGVPPRSTEVEVTLEPDGDATILRLVHRRLPPDAVAFHRAGWDHYLAELGRWRERAPAALAPQGLALQREGALGTRPQARGAPPPRGDARRTRPRGQATHGRAHVPGHADR